MPNPNHPSLRPALKRPASAVKALVVEATEAAKHTHALSTKKRKHMQLRWDEEALEKEKAVLKLRRTAIKGNFKEFNEILEKIVKLEKETAYRALQEDEQQLCIDMFIGAYHSLKCNAYDKEEFINALRQCKNLDPHVVGTAGTALMMLYSRNGDKEDDHLEKVRLDSTTTLLDRNPLPSNTPSHTSAVARLHENRMQGSSSLTILKA